MNPLDKPGVWGIPTALGVLIVLLFGGILAVVDTITWDTYFRDASILLAGLGIGHGIDSRSRP